eukprot:gene34388-50683_t
MARAADSQYAAMLRRRDATTRSSRRSNSVAAAAALVAQRAAGRDPFSGAEYAAALLRPAAPRAGGAVAK